MPSNSVAIGHHSREFVSVDISFSLQGSLKPLPTPAEILARNETLEVYICDIEASAGERALQALKSIPGRDEVNLLHVRRFAKPSSLPLAVRVAGGTDGSNEAVSDTSKKKISVVTIILAPTSLISIPALVELLAPLNACVNEQTLNIRTAQVPAHAPTSSEHAQELTRKLWPTVFMNSNPFGPHPTIVASNQAQLSSNAEKWMTLANQLGLAAQGDNRGYSVGVVFVEPIGNIQEAVVGAGDSRLCTGTEASIPSENNPGNPAQHAVLRALDLLARKRRRVANNNGHEAVPNSPDIRKHSADNASLTALEQRILVKDNLKPGGYLALDLDVYITHEPCVMCCMALVHSRVGRCVFGNWMPKTGGFGCADVNEKYKGSPSPEIQGFNEGTPQPKENDTHPLGYGLFWRSDLNWRFLAWHFAAIESDAFATLPEDAHV